MTLPDDSTHVKAWGPASLSNLGPGFDTLGVCLEGLGDVVEVWRIDDPEVMVIPGDGPWEPPAAVLRNTAARAAGAAWRALGGKGGIAVRVTKGLLPGSGLGSSAASAVAGAWAVHMLLGADADDRRSEAIPSILEGERAATPSVHGDNVVPALMGGVVLVQPDDPTRFRRIPVPVDAWFSILRPRMQVLTEEARAVLPRSVPLRDAVANGAELAFLVDSLRAGDLASAGRAMSGDRIVEPVRIRLVPGFKEIKSAALEAGALGCTLSGSGPAIFALSTSRDEAETILEAMATAGAAFHPKAAGAISRIDSRGARLAQPGEPPVVL